MPPSRSSTSCGAICSARARSIRTLTSTQPSSAFSCGPRWPCTSPCPSSTSGSSPRPSCVRTHACLIWASLSWRRSFTCLEACHRCCASRPQSRSWCLASPSSDRVASCGCRGARTSRTSCFGSVRSVSRLGSITCSSSSRSSSRRSSCGKWTCTAGTTRSSTQTASSTWSTSSTATRTSSTPTPRFAALTMRPTLCTSTAGCACASSTWS